MTAFIAIRRILRLLRPLASVPLVLGVVAGLSASPGGPADAAVGTWGSTGPVQARLISAVEGVGSQRNLPLGLEVRLEPGWKTYWRSPGDAGLPPRLDWSGSVNLAGAELAYPAPRRHSLLGFETAGYEGTVVFPIRAAAESPDRAVSLRVAAELLACKEICVPVRVGLALDLPAGAAGPQAGSGEADALARAAAAVPGDGASAGLALSGVWADGNALEVELTATVPLQAPDVFIEADPPMSFAAPDVIRLDGGRAVRLRVPLSEPLEPGQSLSGRNLTLTVVDGVRSAEFAATAIGLGTGGAGGLEGVLPEMLLVAVLGGLILNLMPCVLPVLSLKLLNAFAFADRPRRVVRAGFLATAAGIVVSFLGLAAVLIGLRAAGLGFGWGVQFQSPWFLAVMTLVTALFAANLAGLFEIRLPGFVAERIGGQEGDGLAGAFATGALATILATPCSAPFVGTAVGFAFASGPMEVLAIFVGLGVGLSLPWLLVAAFPALAHRLPRPGRWMRTLRLALGGLMAATSVWLGVLFAGAIAPAPPRVADSWVPFDEGRIAIESEVGRVVLVDVTADWCLTCLANERLVLTRGAVAARLAEDGVVAMRADWTRPDPAVSRFLAAHGRYGVPFNIVFGPAAPQGLPLPELLTEGLVIDALSAAQRK